MTSYYRRTTPLPAVAFLLFPVLAVCSDQTANNAPAGKYQQEIGDLRSNSKVRTALTTIVEAESRLVSDLIELTEIAAPPFAEGLRAEHFAEMLREAGLDEVSIDAVGNVIGHRRGRSGDRVIAYTAHLDTVFPAGTDVEVRIEGDTLRAPGIGDNTRGLVVVLAVLRAMQHADIDTEADILFVGNVGEEGLGDLRGVKHLFSEDGPGIDLMIAVDGGKTNRLVYGGVGSHRYRVTMNGPGGHSWGAFGSANPHHALGRAISNFVENAPSVTSGGAKTSYSIGRIGGGTSINSIAFASWMEVDLRSGDTRKLDAIDAVFQAAVLQGLADENDARLKGPELTLEVEQVGNRPAAKGDKRTPLVQRAMAAMKSLGIEPNLKISSTDANYPISIDIPAITLSRGGIGKRSHSLDESWQNKDAHLAIQVGLLTILAEAKLAR